MFESVKKAVSEGQTQLSAEDCGVYAEPEVLSDSEALNAEVEELNSPDDGQHSLLAAGRVRRGSGREIFFVTGF